MHSLSRRKALRLAAKFAEKARLLKEAAGGSSIEAEIYETASRVALLRDGANAEPSEKPGPPTEWAPSRNLNNPASAPNRKAGVS